MPALFSHRRRINGSQDWPAASGDASGAATRANAVCGWYESSLELMQGLAVTEHVEFDEFGAADTAEASLLLPRRTHDAG